MVAFIPSPLPESKWWPPSMLTTVIIGSLYFFFIIVFFSPMMEEYVMRIDTSSKLSSSPSKINKKFYLLFLPLLFYHNLAAIVDVYAFVETSWHRACPYTIKLTSVKAIPL